MHYGESLLLIWTSTADHGSILLLWLCHFKGNFKKGRCSNLPIPCSNMAVRYLRKYWSYGNNFHYHSSTGGFLPHRTCHRKRASIHLLKPNSWTLRFLGIILRVVSLEFFVWISQTRGKGVRFSVSYFSFTVYSNCTVETVRGCVSFKK